MTCHGNYSNEQRIDLWSSHTCSLECTLKLGAWLVVIRRLLEAFKTYLYFLFTSRLQGGRTPSSDVHELSAKDMRPQEQRLYKDRANAFRRQAQRQRALISLLDLDRRVRQGTLPVPSKVHSYLDIYTHRKKKIPALIKQALNFSFFMIFSTSVWTHIIFTFL